MNHCNYYTSICILYIYISFDLMYESQKWNYLVTDTSTYSSSILSNHYFNGLFIYKLK